MDPAVYDAWYDAPRGRWIGNVELSLLRALVQARAGDAILDAGCGTGWFTRRFAEHKACMTGLDISPEALAFARAKGPPEISWALGDVRALPFQDRSFDRVISMTALCFVDDEQAALSEIIRVTRTRFAVGLLNRSSLLHRWKGKPGTESAYRGARWHRPKEMRRLISGLPVDDLVFRSAVMFPSGHLIARAAEKVLPACLPWGSVLIVAGSPRR
ncbi:MAG: class I SAM-dependent methyltransferase [Acidobacteriaceae bacterium]